MVLRYTYTLHKGIMSHRFTFRAHRFAYAHRHSHMLKTEFLNNNGLNQATSNSSEFIRLKGWESEVILLLFTDAISTLRFITEVAAGVAATVEMAM